jgi:hypothetical protein
MSLCARAFFLAAILICLPRIALACLPDSYGHLARHCVSEPQYKKLLNLVFGTSAKPRQIAVLAGVSKYPNLPASLQLPPAEHDVEAMATLLIEKLRFDEIIVLKNEDFTFGNLRYVFENYLPDVLRGSSKSRVLFAFSGHGADFEDSGFLFFPATKTIQAASYTDLTDAVNLTSLKATLAPTIWTAQQFLALINACNGGYFLDVSAHFGSSVLDERGAHGITAGGAKDAVHAYRNVGTGEGSVFFEMVVAALTGGDISVGGQVFEDPSKHDGMVSTTALAHFLTGTIQVIENYRLTPRLGELSPRKAGNQGEFFFITDYERAKTALAQRFPTAAVRVFGAEVKVDASTNAMQQRSPGLYARRQLAFGTFLESEMLVLVPSMDLQITSAANTPLNFTDDVRGSCLSRKLEEGEKLAWEHLRVDCR